MSGVLLAYLGPETIVPLTSVLAAIGGVLLMFGRGTFRLVGNVVKSIFRR